MSLRHFRTRSAAGFGSISRRERYQADVFFADLTGTRRQGRRRRQAPAAETYAEQRPLSLGPLTEREWGLVISMLTRGEADVGRPLTGKAGGNALLVAARIFCDRMRSPPGRRSADVHRLRCDPRRCARTFAGSARHGTRADCQLDSRHKGRARAPGDAAAGSHPRVPG